MRLERVTIEGFGPLAGVDAALEPKRLNLLIGPNECGKSSFASAVVSTLFGFSTLEAEELARPWSGAKHRAEIVFTSLVGRYRVRRDFETHEVEVDQLPLAGSAAVTQLFRGVANPRGKSAEQMQYDEILRGWFGFAEPRLFRESSFVYESALETQVSPELRHLVSGAVEADYQQIQDALLNRLDDLTREHPFDRRARKRVNRSIENRIEKIEELRTTRSRSESVLTELKSRRQERDQMETRLRSLRTELNAKENLHADLESWTKLREEQRKLLKRAPAIGQELVIARRARAQVQEIDRKIAETVGYLANAPDEVESELMRVGMLRSQRARHQKGAEDERRKVEAPARPSWGAPIAIGIVLGGVLGAGAWFALHLPAATVGAVAVGLGTGFLFGRGAGTKNRRTRTLAEAHLRVLEENMRTLSQEIDGIEIRLNPYLAGRAVEVVLEDLKRYRAATQERREAAAVLSSLPTPERLETESQEIDEAVASLRTKEKLLLQQSPFLAPLRDDAVKTAEAAERLKRDANGLRTKIEAEQEALDTFLRRAGASADGDAENLDRLDERIAAEQSALECEERQRDALVLALEVLRDSVLAYQKEHVGRLARDTEAMLRHLTHGRYQRLTLDADFVPRFASAERGDVKLESLSRGTRDAFYLALRASLARELAAREPLPLILDDPIAHFDEERRGALLRVLEEMAGSIQVLLLTHDRRVLNQVREAHVLAVGTAVAAKDSDRKVEIRR
jgi:uncharacterized protein YhaN